MILKAGSGQAQNGRSDSGMSLWMSNYQGLLSKYCLAPGDHWRLILEACSGQGTGRDICFHVCLYIGLLGSGFQFLNQKKYLGPRSRWRLILEASQVQVGWSHLGILSLCLNKGLFESGYKFFLSKIMSGTWRPFEAGSGQVHDHWSMIFSCLQVAKYYFWCENWNPQPNKPLFMKHIRVWFAYLYLHLDFH